MARTLTNIPEELILRIFAHLDRLDDYYSLILTSKLFHRISHDVSPSDISRLALNTGNFLPGLRPYQHTLLLPSARRLADWAVQRKDRRDQLAHAMHGGIDGLVALAMAKAPITLDEIRQTWRWKQEILNPLSEELNQACGRLSTDPEEYMTVCETPSLTLLIWAIYGELFHHSISYIYSSHEHEHPIPFDSVMRFKFLVYCMPDVNAFNYMGVETPTWFESMAGSVDGFQQLSLNHATREYLEPALWGHQLRELIPGILDDDGDQDWNFEYLTKERLLLSAVMGSGTRALDVLQATSLRRQQNPEWSEDLIVWLGQLRQKIDSLPLMESEAGDISSGPPYDPWFEENWVTLAWDKSTTLWDAGPYTLREEVCKQYGGEEEAWDAAKRAIGEDLLGSQHPEHK
ncbi:hypothetical protein PRZ48_013442 [Zasmidium cellare]|uniref:F-box domain-containing protein n=1 Tax=Zasmidium cellare TaxID=395010 RepID=A0ABR0E1G6_ZASCE|nr:hypothetical protein PRZ48_013442 [Zasmidium cellare]